MQEGLESIVRTLEAIRLSSDKSLFEQAFIPAISTLAGAVASLGTIVMMDRRKRSRRQVDIVNTWNMAADKVLMDLVNKKANYYQNLSQDPVMRLFVVVRRTVGSNATFEGDASQLGFFTRYRRKFKEDYLKKYCSPNQIYMLQQNYLSVLDMWKQLEEKFMPIKEAFISLVGLPDFSVHRRLAYDFINANKLQLEIARLIVLHEKVLSLTDDLILELFELCECLPVIGDKCINRFDIFDYDCPWKFDQRPSITTECFEPICKVDPEPLHRFFGIGKDIISEISDSYYKNSTAKAFYLSAKTEKFKPLFRRYKKQLI